MQSHFVILYFIRRPTLIAMPHSSSAWVKALGNLMTAVVHQVPSESPETTELACMSLIRRWVWPEQIGQHTRKR
jgi:hypothetical protein